MSSKETTLAVDSGNGTIRIANALPLTVFAGPCAMESRAHALECALGAEGDRRAARDRARLQVILRQGEPHKRRLRARVGLKEAAPVFAEIRESVGLPVVTDVHEAGQCAPVAEAVDVLQIPAFLCRQTDLLVAAAKTGRVVKIKKGQFLAPWDMKNVVEKVRGAGNGNVLVTERGASFGYNTLVSDFRSLPIMARETGCPVIFDITHSVQTPGGAGTTSGGQREFAPTLARAAVAVGVAGVFAETHPDPDSAPSDGPNMIPLGQFEAFLKDLLALDKIAKARSSLHGFSE